MLIVYLIISWFVGIWLGSIVELSAPIGGSIAVLSFFAGMMLLRYWQGAIALICLGLVALGGVRYQRALPVINAHHIAFYNDNLTVNIKGVVVDEPEVRDRFVNLRVAVSSIENGVGDQTAVSGIVLVQAFRYPEVAYGDELLLNGRLLTPPSDGDFDYAAYLANQNVYAMMTFPSLTVVGHQQANPIRNVILRLKGKARQTINQSLVEPHGALLTGILLGDDNGIPQSLADDFNVTGMTHIIAISGFNIAIIIWVLLALARPFFSPRGTALFALVGISLYTLLVGADPPVVRAAIMGGLYLIVAAWLGRPTFPLASLMWAGFLLSVHTPSILWDVGFQLSFMATLSLMMFSEPMTEWVHGRLLQLTNRAVAEKVLGITSEAVIVTLSAQILTLPLMMYHFNTFSPISFVANALILPAQPGVMLWGGLATVAGMLIPQLGVVLGWVAWLFLQYTIGMVRLLAAAPGASLEVSLSGWGLVTIYVGVALLAWFIFQPAKRQRQLVAKLCHDGVRRLATSSSVLATLVIFNWGMAQPDGRLHLYFLNVGQGDATLMVTPSGRTILVDGGFYPSILTSELGKHLPFWQRQIDLMVATHPDADHVSALVEVFERYRVEMLITNGSELGETAVYDAVLDAAMAEEAVVRTAVAGEQIIIEDGVALQILHPGTDRNPQNRNENSVAMRVTYGDFAYLFTGDAEVFAERAMVQSGLPLHANVLKAGHHGSRTSSTLPFLEQVRPDVMIVSAGLDNRFGHPHPEVLVRAALMETAVLRTDQLGTIELITDGNQVWWFAHR